MVSYVSPPDEFRGLPTRARWKKRKARRRKLKGRRARGGNARKGGAIFGLRF